MDYEGGGPRSGGISRMFDFSNIHNLLWYCPSLYHGGVSVDLRGYYTFITDLHAIADLTC